MWAKIWDTLVRWRTWLINVVLGSPLALDVIMVLLGYNWGTILPPHWMPYVGITLAIANVIARPRPAVRKDDLEASVSRSRQ